MKSQLCLGYAELTVVSHLPEDTVSDHFNDFLDLILQTCFVQFVYYIHK